MWPGKLRQFYLRGVVSGLRPRHLGRFCGPLSRGRDSFGRGHYPMPFHLALQASHGASGGLGFYVPPSGQPALIRAPPLQRYYHGQSVH